MEKDKDVAYLVSIRFGDIYDFGIENAFITKDYEKAEKWIEKFNKIVQNNYDRINHYYDDDIFHKTPPLWFEKIYSNEPVARLEEIEFR